MDFNNSVILQWGKSTNTKICIFPIAFNSIPMVVFGILFKSQQYGYDDVIDITNSQMTFYNVDARLTQMYICIGY